MKPQIKETMKKIILLLVLSIILSPLASSPVVLTLEGLMSAIRMNNSELIELQQHLIQGELDEDQARARRFGSLEASVGFQFMANPPLGPITTNTDTLFSQLTLPPGVSFGENQFITLYEGMEHTLFDSSLTYTLPLFTWGKINATVDLYESLRSVKEAQLREKMSVLSSETQSQISTLFHLNTIISLLKEQKTIADRLLSIAKNSNEVGAMTLLEYKEKQGELLSIDSALIETKFEKEKVLASLEKLSDMEDLSQSLIDDTTKISDIISYAEQPIHELIHMGQMSIMPIISGLENAEDASNALYDVAKGNLYGKPDFAFRFLLVIVDLAFLL